MLLQAFLLLFSLEVGVAERSLRGGQNEWSVNATKMNIVDTLDERKLIIGGSVARSGEYPYFGMLFSFYLPISLVFPMTNVLRLFGISHFYLFFFFFSFLLFFGQFISTEWHGKWHPCFCHTQQNRHQYFLLNSHYTFCVLCIINS